MVIQRVVKLALVGMVALLVSGCGGGGPKLVSVSGQVTLDGQPLQGAKVVFQPQGADKSPSFAETDSEGRFELAFNRNKKGAVVGKHLVQVTTAKVTTDDQGKETEVPEKLPPHYHRRTELEFEVNNGENSIDIPLELKSKPKGTSRLAGPVKAPC